jgi:hypothetical protein
MDVFAGLVGLLIGAAAAWSLVAPRIAYWRSETERARANVARIAEQAAAYAAGCQQGRDDVLSLARVLAAPQVIPVNNEHDS